MSQNPVDTARTILEKLESLDEADVVLDSEKYNKDTTGKGDEVHTDEGPNNEKKNKATIKPKPSAAKADSKYPEVTPDGGNQAGGGVKEDLEVLFDGEDLTEDFKLKAITIFEAAINEKVEAEVAEIEEAYQNKLVEEIAEVTQDLTEKIDEYLDYAVQNWLEENYLMVEQGIRTEVAESFMSGLRDLFADHYIEVPETKVDLVDELAEENEELVNRLNDEIERTMELSEELLELQREIVFNNLSEGLVDTEVERFRSLTENIEHVDIDEYAEKINIVRESYFGEELTESFEDDNTEGTPRLEETNSLMEGYARALKTKRI